MFRVICVEHFLICCVLVSIVFGAITMRRVNTQHNLQRVEKREQFTENQTKQIHEFIFPITYSHQHLLREFFQQHTEWVGDLTPQHNQELFLFHTYCRNWICDTLKKRVFYKGAQIMQWNQLTMVHQQQQNSSLNEDATFSVVVPIHELTHVYSVKNFIQLHITTMSNNAGDDDAIFFVMHFSLRLAM